MRVTDGRAKAVRLVFLPYLAQRREKRMCLREICFPKANTFHQSIEKVKEMKMSLLIEQIES